MKRKLLHLALVLAILLQLAPVHLPGARAAEATPSAYDAVTWSYDADAGALTITGSGAMEDYTGGTANHAPWSRYADEIRTVTVRPGITAVGENAFACLPELRQVTLPSSVTDITGAFRSCTKLRKITLPEGITAMDHAFAGCSSLTDITLPTKVTSLEGTFADCTALTALTLPGGLTSIGYRTFAGCTSLQTVRIPYATVRIGSYAFADCTGLKQATLQEGLQIIDPYAFSNCIGLQSLYIPASVRAIGDNAFIGCHSLSGYTVAAGNTTYSATGGVLYRREPQELLRCPSTVSGTFRVPGGVTHIAYYAFSGCSALSGIQLPGTLTSIDPGAFDGCKNLQTLELPASVRQIESPAFAGCDSLSGIHTAAGNTRYTSINGVLYTKDLSTLVRCPSTLEQEVFQISTGTERLADGAFAGCKNLRTITIPASVTEIAPDAFAGCAELQAFTVAADNPAYGCDSQGVLYSKDLSTLRCLPGGSSGIYTVADGVTTIWPYAFGGCADLTGVILPTTVTNINDHAFAGSGVTAIYYTGTRSQWEACGFAPEVLPPDAVIYFNSCTAHVPVSDPYVAPVCATPGKTAGSHCSLCGNVLVPQQQIDPPGHQWDAGRITTPASTRDGIMTYRCKTCGDTKTIAIPGICSGSCPSVKFRDVPEPANWAHSGIDFMVSRRLMNGMSTTTFGPKVTMTRAMVVTILYRLAGEPRVYLADNEFDDVADDAYYTRAVIWANNTGITTGTKPGVFNPDGNITREQMATFLYRYASYQSYDTLAADCLGRFPDAGHVSSYAGTPLNWAVDNGIITGSQTSAGVRLLPQGNATREQIATIFMRFVRNIAP